MPASFPLLFFLLLLLPIPSAHSQPLNFTILFSDLPPPPSFTPYTPANLSPPSASILTGPPRLPAPFRSFVTNTPSFRYTIPVPPGRYTLRLAFYEFLQCRPNRRRFTISVNSRSLPPIDIFSRVGCNKPLFIHLFNFRVATPPRILLNATSLSGAPPLLTHVRVIRKPTLPTPTPQPPTRVIRSIVFTDGPVPTNWTRYNPRNFNHSVQLFLSPLAPIRAPFRSYVTSNGPLTYIQRGLGAGALHLLLGFAELNQAACALGNRVFAITVNRIHAGPVDIFRRVGCRRGYVQQVPVRVPPSGVIIIRLIPIRGLPPILSNFRIVRRRRPAAPALTRTTAPTTTRVAATAPPGPGSGRNPRGGATGAASQLKVVRNINAGGSTDVPGAVSGATQVFANLVPIAGTSDPAKFSTHRFGNSFSYVLRVKPNVVYGVDLFFAESFEPGCKVDFRLFSVKVHDSARPVASGKALNDINVFAEAGCRTALQKTVTAIRVGPSGSLTIMFKASQNNAMISALRIFTRDPNFESAPEATPDPTSAIRRSFAEVDAGSDGDLFVAGTSKFSINMPVIRTASVTQAKLQTSRFGTDFTYRFNLKPGAYDVLLAFSENFNQFCQIPGKRVFNVYINGMIQLEGFDIFAQAGCRKGIEIMLAGHTVGAVETQALTLRFEAIVNFAQINYIRIRSATRACVPISTTGTITEDHAAHAVPGSYPPQLSANSPKSFVDSAGLGYVKVNIDGSRSHTHFIDAANDIIGQINSYTWTIVETGQVISRKARFVYKFPLGTTRLKLAVTDNACTSDEAETTVTVTGKIQPGIYCYYFSGLTQLPLAGADASTQTPQFAAVSNTLNLGFPQFSFANTKFAARCQFFLEIDANLPNAKVTIQTFGTGDARVFKGEDLIIDSTASKTARTALNVGLIGFEIVYLRTSLAMPPKLALLVNDNIPGPAKISHDRTTVRPILKAVTPSDGPVSGGTRVKVSGYGLFPPLTVKFGGKNAIVLPANQNPSQFFVDTPSASNAGNVQVVVTSGAGIKSNSITFSYGGTSCDDVEFVETKLTNPGGSDVDLDLPTSAAIGQDGKIYMGTLIGSVRVLTYNPVTLKAISQCYSKEIRDPAFGKNGNAAERSILGLAFDPKDKVIRPYVSTSTLDWWDKDRIARSNMKAWQNGAIDRLKPGTDPSDTNICLVYDKRIVSGLPVSNHDHSVNALVFTQQSDLLIAVGGYTNAGLPGYKLGGFWEPQLGGAVLIAKLSKPGFNGQIVYSNPNFPRLAKKISGDVDLYATGFRNTFAMAMTTTGDVYAADNGPNCSFGNTASTCADYDEAMASTWDWEAKQDWPGKVEHGPPSCKYGIGRPDKILHVTKGSWYGHPNILRNECAWIDPFDHLTADDKNPPAGLNYKRPMELIESPTTGIGEYRANHFCGKLRGELILTTFKNGKTFRMSVNGPNVISGPNQFSPNGGLMFVENERGDLIFPRLNQKDIFVMRPDVATPSGLFIAGAIPFRHGKAGGTKIIIGGNNFGNMPTVKIGGKVCLVLQSTSIRITCKVPAFQIGGAKALTVETASGESSTLPGAVLYTTT